MLTEIAVHLDVHCPFQLICRFIDVNVGITIKIIEMHFLVEFIPILAFAYIFPTGVNVNVNEIHDKNNNDENGKQQFKTMKHLIVP